MIHSHIKVQAPCTIANMGSGFDIMGLAIDEAADIIELTSNTSCTIEIKDIVGANLSKNINDNIVGKVIQSTQKKLGITQGVDVKLTKCIVPGSGLGSSAASAVGAVYAYNELVNGGLSKEQMLELALDGEELATGARHADNIAPCLYGGITLAQHKDKIHVTNLPLPTDIRIVVVYPQIQIKTADARAVLPTEVLLKDAIAQWSQVAGLVAGLCMNDHKAIARSMQDVLIVPHRSQLIPDYTHLEQSLQQAGVLGCSISGSGPSIFALCDQNANTQEIEHLMKSHFQSKNINTQSWVTSISTQGVKTIQ